jgi:hypothetical protein
MKNLLREVLLPNGLILQYFDHTRNYYGDYYLVRMEIAFNVPVLAEYFKDRETYVEAKRILGEEIAYSRIEEQMGVPSSNIDGVMDRLIANFTDHALPYISSGNFPHKFVLAKLNKMKRNN